MNRKDFLRGAGLLGLGGLVSARNAAAAAPSTGVPVADNLDLMVCTVTPTETAGPFPWASGTNINSSVFWRSDIREPNTPGSGLNGIPLTVKMRVINVANCTPVANARVDLWHCNEAGAYSGYSGMGNPNYVGHTWLRGIQQTDSEGYVTFKTVFPGWYNGRIQHIHFQVFVAGVSKLISQFTFTTDLMNAINGVSPYTAIPGKVPYGPSPSYPGANSIATYAADNIFNNGTAGQILNVTGDVNTGLFGTLDVVVNYATGASAANLNNFNGGVSDGKAMLWFSAEQKPGFSHFEIEKAHDFEEFETIARIEGKGILGENAHYSFTDRKRLRHDAQYRLKIVNKDGTSDCTVYLPMKAAQNPIVIRSNPANEHLVVSHPEVKGGEATFTVLTPEGQELLRGPIQYGATASLLEVKGIRSGDYLLVYDDAQSLHVVPFSKK